MKEYKCKIINEGFFIGLAYKKKVLLCNDSVINVDEEIIKLENTVLNLRQKSNFVSDSINNDFEEIIQMIIEDDSFIDKIKNIIKDELCDACHASLKAAESISSELNSSTYMAERGADIRGAAERIINEINKQDDSKTIDYELALVADEISPADMLSIDKNILKAIISVKGSTTSHAALIAANLNIPYILCSKEAFDCISDGSLLIVNGYDGILIVEPDEKIIKNTTESITSKVKNDIDILSNQVNITNNKPKICVNYSGTENISEILNSNADGIGLFRTELKFMNNNIYPSEEEQYSVYKEIVKTMSPKDVIIRTFDIGSEKKVNWLTLSNEKNPALGLRGTRVMLEHRDLFSIQLKALLRAAIYGNMKIMFPMISSKWEIDEIKKEIKSVIEDLERRKEKYKIPPLGIMIETPAAVFCAENLAKEVDFFSIGTNDLSQYTFAIDRESNLYDNYSSQMKQVLVDMINHVIKSAHNNNIEVGICGQMATDPELIKKFVELDVDELSVSINSVKKIKSMCQ